MFCSGRASLPMRRSAPLQEAPSLVFATLPSIFPDPSFHRMHSSYGLGLEVEHRPH